jgi:hypothetical protein
MKTRPLSIKTHYERYQKLTRICKENDEKWRRENPDEHEEEEYDENYFVIKPPMEFLELNREEFKKITNPEPYYMAEFRIREKVRYRREYSDYVSQEGKDEFKKLKGFEWDSMSLDEVLNRVWTDASLVGLKFVDSKTLKEIIIYFISSTLLRAPRKSSKIISCFPNSFRKAKETRKPTNVYFPG